jgi:RHS repeat-associated protein
MRLNRWKPVLILAAFVLSLLALPAPSAAQSWPNGYSYRRPITIDHTKVPNTDQINFPVVISGTYSFLASTGNGGNVTNANGYDIIFTSDAAGSNTLNFEQESYSVSTGAVNYWVKIPTVSHTSDTVFYMFYGKSSVTTDQSSKTGVWDSNFAFVSHMSDSAANTTVADSTSNTANGTASKNTTGFTTTGKIGQGFVFNRTTLADKIATTLHRTSAFTWEAWFKSTFAGTYENILSIDGTNYVKPLVQQPNLAFYTVDGSSFPSIIGLTSGQWYHFVLVRTGDSGHYVTYLNGSQVFTNNSGTLALGNAVTIGFCPDATDQGFDGALDEVRISNSARSADWISTEYNNESSPPTFYTVGPANPPSISSLSPSSGAVGTSVTITGTRFGSTQGSSTVTFNGRAASPTSWGATSIVVPVPSGATPGDVVVTVSGVASNSAFFMVPTAWSNGYSYRRAITIDHTKVPNTDQTNFPVLVSGTYSYLANTGSAGYVTSSNGYDIIFTSDPAGTSTLSYETEGYNSSTGAVNYWIKIPTVSHTSNETVFYMFYGNSSVTTDQSNKTAVWDSNYKGVWHLPNGTTLTANDSTSNGNNGTISGATATTGQIGGGAGFNGSGKITVSPASSLTAPFTIEEWAEPANLNSGLGLFGSRSPNDQGFDAKLTGSAVYADIGSGSSWLATGVAGNFSYSANTWHHFVYAVTTSGYKIYVDGSQIGSGTISGTPLLYDSNHTLAIGWTGYSSENFNGSIDETRVSNIARSADWIATEYSNESSPSTFYSVWSAAAASGGSGGNLSIASLSPTSAAIGASVAITGTNFNGAQNDSTVTFNGVTATPTSWSDGKIVVTVPSGATTGNVVVRVSGVNSNGVSFTVLPTPSITSLSPSSAPIGGSLNVNGTGFVATQGSGQVNFGSLVASVTSWSATSIAVTVPSGATSGPVTVAASGVMSNSAQFTLTQAASVTSISPTTGLIGSSVTINGANFGATQGNSTVAFNTIPVTAIASWSATQIVAIVPLGASPGAISVKVAGITAQGPTFVPTSKAQVTDSLGNSSTYTGAVNGGQWHPVDSQGSGCSSCSVRGTYHYAYDASGNVTSTTDPLGHVMSDTFDSSNHLTSELVHIDANTTATTSYTYNSFAEPLTVTDALGHVTTNVYDTHGNLTSVTSPAPNGSTAASVTNFAYDSKGELTSITDPLNHVTTMTYTTAALIATITDAQNHVTTYGYDTHGNRTSVTDALNHQTTFTYDTMDRLTKITYPDNTTSTFAYDSRGRRTSVTDQNSKTTTYTYDDADRLTKVTDAANHVTTYAYDTENNLTSITDANSHLTAFTYDAFGRVTKTTFPSTLPEFYAYDADNNLTSKTDRKNQTINYVYDGLNRLTKKQYPNSTEVDYVYDLVGKIQSVNDPTGTYSSAYDNMGRLIGTTTSYNFLTSRNFVNAYTYDAASNRTGFTDPENGSTTYSYDTLNRLTTLAPPSAFTTGSFGFSYDALSRRTQMTRPNSVATNYTYDNLSRLLSVLHQLSGSTIDGASYTVDSAGNRTAKTDQRAAVTSNYTYDAIYELTQVMQGTNTTESYTYDPVGNRTASLGVSSYTTNASNELTAIPGVTYTYDSNGNTLTKLDSTGTTTYAWDFEDRLASVTLPGAGGTVSIKYDPFGRRIYKSSSSGTSVFAYDGDNFVEETNATGTAVARYSLTEDTDEPLALLRSGATSYYEADGLGSITSMTNSSGVAAETYTYDSFGKRAASTGALTNPFQYTAREFDTETGLYYYRARYYDQSTGRFLNEDPLGFGGGINFYPYVGNNPPNAGDPFGLRAQIAPSRSPLPTRPMPPRPIIVPDPPPSSLFDTILDFLGDVLGPPIIILGSPMDLSPNEPDPGKSPTPTPNPRRIPEPDCPGRGCTCTCRADADDTMPGNIKPGLPLFAFGTATASSCFEASRQAKRIATRALGMKPKHIPCKCSGR